ncbi:hypothetical protein WJX73_006969 [Symbiochloris irregularis]|uniref:Mediator of RNA polymerase II transcription subunit 31 n=1 Tax=Symbiochloris irregularis TaxID=706552 RepID=A0AAW1PZX4_9CHLO
MSAVEASDAIRRADEKHTGCSDRERYLLELEFVQCLANPHYLNWLAQHQYFDETAFINYLAYLQYWQRPEHACHISYPHCLFFLEMLQSKQFRTAMARADVTEMVHSQQFFFWQHYRQNRFKASVKDSLADMEQS